MFRRNGLPTRLLTAVLAIAMAWATTPTQGLAEALTTTPQTQTTTSASSDASSDASTSNSTPTGEKDLPPAPRYLRRPYAPSPYHLRRYSSGRMSPAATSSMSCRFSEAVSCTMESSYITDTPPSSGSASPM